MNDLLMLKKLILASLTIVFTSAGAAFAQQWSETSGSKDVVLSSSFSRNEATTSITWFSEVAPGDQLAEVMSVMSSTGRFSSKHIFLGVLAGSAVFQSTVLITFVGVSEPEPNKKL